MFKKDIRVKYKELRHSLSENQIEELSLAIANEVLLLPIWEKTYFHIFLTIEEQKEVNTEYILHLLSGKDKEIVVSKSDFYTRKMTHFLLTDNTKIKKNE
jgi:5-formyltetrahydrofolate cyclo-ligase